MQQLAHMKSDPILVVFFPPFSSSSIARIPARALLGCWLGSQSLPLLALFRRAHTQLHRLSHQAIQLSRLPVAIRDGTYSDSPAGISPSPVVVALCTHFVETFGEFHFPLLSHRSVTFVIWWLRPMMIVQRAVCRADRSCAVRQKFRPALWILFTFIITPDYFCREERKKFEYFPAATKKKLAPVRGSARAVSFQLNLSPRASVRPSVVTRQCKIKGRRMGTK